MLVLTDDRPDVAGGRMHTGIRCRTQREHLL